MPVDARAPTVLIVDDEVAILSALRRCLRREGYRILTADTPEAALRALDESVVDLVLSDHKMPAMDGLELLAEARKRQPNAARLLISGWSEAIPPGQLEALGVRSVLPKPWDDAELKRALRDALARGRRRPVAQTQAPGLHHGAT